jgi:hypothetical protein
MKSKILKTIAVGTMLATPLLVGAQLDVVTPGQQFNVNDALRPENQNDLGVTSVNDAYGLISKLVGYFIALFWILTVVFFILAAINYITAAGDEKKIAKAKAMVKYGIIGVIVALFSTAIRSLVLNVLAGN